MAYSQDYRQMILDKLNSGYSYRELAAEYGISRSTIQLWKKSIERKPYPKRTNKINDELLRKDVEQFPDDFQRERAVRFNCSPRAIGVALKLLKITQKKRYLNTQKLNTKLLSNFSH